METKFYQPKYNEETWDSLGINSFDVWISKEKCQEEFPNEIIEEFTPEDIEDPVIIDE